MFPAPNYQWKCKNCGKEIFGHKDESPTLNAVPQRCEECGGEMKGTPIVHRGPFPEHPNIKY